MSRPVTRFAPSPTGYLHLGHVASAVFVWGLGRAVGARILLRIEDHDASRCRKEYEKAIFDDLAWLGLEYDNTELKFGTASEYRQSDSRNVYEATLKKLAGLGHLYACDCSRRQIAADAQSEDSAEDAELRYLGRCRTRGLSLTTPQGGIRLETPSQDIAFEDLCLGRQIQNPALQCGDLLLKDRIGQYTYQYAVTVDDMRQGVDLIVRGQDLTESSGRQIWLGRFLGREADARFFHHPLLTDAQGKKLSKRFFSEGVAKRREAGEPAAKILGEAAHLAGLLPKPATIKATDLPSLLEPITRNWGMHHG